MTDVRAEFEQIRPQLISQLPSECQNCDECSDLHVHHIVPIALGGTNKVSNLAMLCVECHGKIHGKDFIKSKRLQAEGIARAIAGGKVFGRPKRNYVTMSDDEKADFTREYSEWKSGNQSAVITYKRLRIPKATFYKIAKEFEHLAAIKAG